MKYRSKPVVIEAMQWTGQNTKELKDWIKKVRDSKSASPVLVDGNDSPFFSKRSIPAWIWKSHIADSSWDDNILGAIYDYLHATYVGVRQNDFIIRGTKGEFYPCDPEVFREKYEVAE